MNKKLCNNCQSIIPKALKVCPYCKKPQYSFQNEKEKRNAEIVFRLKTGFYTLESLSTDYGITRERIRQIFKREGGMSMTELRGLYRRGEKQRYCNWCGKEVPSNRKWCSPEHKEKWWAVRRLPEETFTCDNCGKQYHPFRVHKWVDKRLHVKHHFCSRKCNMEYIHKHYMQRESFIKRVVLPALKGGDFYMKTFGQLSEAEKRDAYLFIVKYWGKMTSRELAEKLSLKDSVIPPMVARLRKAGVNLPKISGSFILTPSFIDELKQTFNGR